MLIIVILVVYMAAMLFIGQMGKKYSTTLEDSLTAGKQGTLIMVAGSFLGSHIGTGIVVGGATNGAKYGLGGGWFGVGAAISFALFAFFTARWARHNNFVTLPTYFRARYPKAGKAMTVICAVAGVLGATANIAAQIIAGKQLFTYIGINPFVGSTISMLVILFYCSAAGLWGVMMTDVWQVVIIFIGMIAALISLFCFHDGTAAIASLDPSYFKAVPFDAETLLWMVLPGSIWGLISSSSIQRAVSAKTEKIAVQGSLIGAAGTFLVTFLPVTIGMYGIAVFPDADPSTILFKVLFHSLPTVLAGLVLAAIVAAVMSTCDTQIMAILANALHDAYLSVLAPKFHLKTDEKRMKVLSTVITLAVLIGALLLSFRFNNIQKLLSNGLSITVASSVIPFMGGRLMKKGTGAGALAAMGTALVLLALNLAGVIHLINGLVSLIPAAIVYVVVSLATYKETEDCV